MNQRGMPEGGCRKYELEVVPLSPVLRVWLGISRHDKSAASFPAPLAKQSSNRLLQHNDLTISQDGDYDVGLHPAFQVMVNRTNPQMAPQNS